MNLAASTHPLASLPPRPAPCSSQDGVRLIPQTDLVALLAQVWPPVSAEWQAMRFVAQTLHEIQDRIIYGANANGRCGLCGGILPCPRPCPPTTGHAHQSGYPAQPYSAMILGPALYLSARRPRSISKEDLAQTQFCDRARSFLFCSPLVKRRSGNLSIIAEIVTGVR